MLDLVTGNAHSEARLAVFDVDQPLVLAGWGRCVLRIFGDLCGFSFPLSDSYDRFNSELHVWAWRSGVPVLVRGFLCHFIFLLSFFFFSLGTL